MEQEAPTIESILARPILYDLPQEVEMPLKPSQEPLAPEEPDDDQTPVAEIVLKVPVGIDLPEEVENPLRRLEEP